MNKITIIMNDVPHSITPHDHFYDEIKEYHEMLTGKAINIGIVTIDGNTEWFKIISNKPLLEQIPKFSSPVSINNTFYKYILMYDGKSIKGHDTPASLNMSNPDLIDAIKSKN